LEIWQSPYISGFIYNGDDNSVLKKYTPSSSPFIINPKIRDGYQHDAPLIDSDKYMAFLSSMVHAAEIPVVHYVVDNLFRDFEKVRSHLHEQGLPSNPAVVVNASGLASRFLVDDEKVYARRGAVYRFPFHERSGDASTSQVSRIPNIDILKTNAFCIPVSELNEEQGSNLQDPDAVASFGFVIPRGDHSITIGGFSEALPDEDLKKSFDYYRKSNKMDAEYTRRDLDREKFQARVSDIRKQATAFLQPVKDLFEVHADDAEDYLITGLRPFRIGGARLAVETRANMPVVIHNYGHGGSGVSWSVGCAVEVAHLTRKSIAVRLHTAPPKSLKRLSRSLTREYIFTSVPREKEKSVRNVLATLREQ